MKTAIKEYLKLHPYEIVFAILMADAGEREILEKITGSESAAFNLLKQARFYGETAKIYPIHDYPIAVSESGELSKMIFRLAGLLLVGQEYFYAVTCNRPGEVQPDYKFTKEEKKQLSDFIKLFFTESPETIDSPRLDSPVRAISKDLPLKKS